MAGLSGGALYRILEDANFTVLGGTAVEGAEARLAPVPPGLAPAVRDVLTQRWPNGLYAHQAEALIETSSGHDICLATSTASGKSLVFMSAAADALQRDPKRKVLAIYPARALIQDQAAKWKEMLGTLGFSSSIIDGGVQVDQRIGRLKDNHVILMTPDVLSRFHAQQTPLGTGPLQGMCIFDSTHGSLRLTEKLAVNFPEIVEMALQIVKEQEHGPRTDPLSWMASSG